ncbi:MAG: AMP-binding protein, partial [Bacteroidota bacterium]
MEPKRLFDCIQYHLERKPLPDMLAAKESGQWRTYSTQEVKDMVDKLAGGLINMGISGGDMTDAGRDKVAILCKNRPEWIILDLAVQQIGAVLTPVYPTINVNELEFIFNDAQVKMIFVNDEDGYNKVMSIKDRLPSVKDVFSFEHVANARHWREV